LTVPSTSETRDFDPSGEDMVRSLRERLASLVPRPESSKCAFTSDDVQRYNLPLDCSKTIDTRRAVAKYGDIAVELARRRSTR
jgi:hypothetical protein